MNRKGNMSDQISETKRKVEGAYQTIIALAGDSNFRDIEMKTIWKLIDTCLRPIILYGAETWNLTKKENEEYNRILDGIIKRILKTPTSTPREVLYMETGILDIEAWAEKNRITMANRIHDTKDEFVKEALRAEHSKSWAQVTKIICEKHGITTEDIAGNKASLKRKTQANINENFKTRIELAGQDKSKVKHLTQNSQDWEPGKSREYMKTLSRNQASIIFKSRTRMLDVKNNYRGKYPNLVCRGCGKEDETQTHVLDECSTTTEQGILKVDNTQIFSEDTEVLKEAARKITKIMENLEKQDAAPQGNGTATKPSVGGEDATPDATMGGADQLPGPASQKS